MTRNKRQARSDFPDWTVAKLSHHYYFFFFFLSNNFLKLDWDSWKFLITLLFFLSFFLSFFIIFGNWTKIAENFSSLFFSFFFFFYPLLTYYLARDSCKKWQEIIGKLGLICPYWTVGKLSRHYFFFIFLSNNFRKLDWDSWKFLVTILFFLFFLLLFLLLQNFRKLGSESWKFLVTILFFFLFSFF